LNTFNFEIIFSNWLAHTFCLLLNIYIFSKLANLVHTVNTEFFKFNLYGFGEPLQLTEYTAPGGHYAYHVDREYNSMIRKLSVSVQLSNPKKYSGGKLIINGSELPADAYEQGSVVMFPSVINHTVLPVSEGKRYALVAWITGDNFK
jgi:PKHD-type hydroxylase